MLEGLKPRFNAALRPMVRPFIKIGITPNHLTIFGLVLFAISAWFIWKGLWYWAFGIALVGALLDGLDGVLARESGKTTVFGAILDSSCDRLTEILFLLGVLGFLLCAPIISFDKHALTLKERGMGVVFCYTAISMSLCISYIKARCEGAGVSCKEGLMQRPERLILFGVGILAGPRAMVWILAALSILGAITVVQRFYTAYQGSKLKEKSEAQKPI